MALRVSVVILFLFMVWGRSIAQQSETPQDSSLRIVQFSGLVVEGDSMLAIPGVFIFDPKSGRGASTNLLGYFSLPVQPGDSLIVAAVGYQKQTIGIPTENMEFFNVLIQMHQDTVNLPTVLVTAFPTEQVFKRAFLEMEVVNQQDLANMNNNLNDQIMARLLANSEMGASLNHTYYMNQQVTALENKYMQTTVPLLDPFAWARFIKDVKSEIQKKKDRKKQEENDRGYWISE